MVSLEKMLEDTFVENEVKPELQQKLMQLLDILKLTDYDTYEHSIRVGLLASKVGTFLHLDSKALFYAGLMHDIGNALVNPVIIQKKQGFSAEDYEELIVHPEESYRLLKGLFDFTAEIVLRYPRFQEQGYPQTLPQLLYPYSLSTQVIIDHYARILALIHFYDTLSSSGNDMSGDASNLAGEKIKSIMQEKNPDARQLIEELFDNSIFQRPDVAATEAQMSREIEVQKQIPLIRTPSETRRFASLALALEPLYIKKNCTTRYTDCSRHLKLEYFVAGAINVGAAFENLAIRVSGASEQPESLYDLAYEAQLDSKRNRDGGRINQGMIEMLIPIVAAQSMYDSNHELTLDELLLRAQDVLKQTSIEDVANLVKMKQLAFDLSAYDRKVPEYKEASTVFDYYALDLKASKKQTSIMHNGEFVNGFPVIKGMYAVLRDTAIPSFRERVRLAYLDARKGLHKEVSAGLTADCVGTAIYLALSQNPLEPIIN